MNIEYYELTSEIDAREILRYLNNLGIHNISGEVLKYFITDLKKLIKYDLQRRNRELSGESQKFQIQGPERLHSASTFSSRVKSKVAEGEVLICSRECRRIRKPLHILNTHSAPNIGEKLLPEKPLRRACSCIRIEKKSQTSSSIKTNTVSNNLIKVPKQPPVKKCDPVSLYHYYTSLWEKYKSNVPGENNWSDLRWSVRQKMAGNMPKQIKVPEVQPKAKQETMKD